MPHLVDNCQLQVLLLICVEWDSITSTLSIGRHEDVCPWNKPSLVIPTGFPPETEDDNIVIMVVQGGGRSDRPDPATSARLVHGVDSSRAVHRVDVDPTSNPAAPAAFDTENALPNCT